MDRLAVGRLFHLIQFSHILHGAVVHMTSPDIIVDNGKNHHRAVDEAGPVHRLDCGIQRGGEEGKNEGEDQEHYGEAVQEESHRSGESEFGRKER